MNKIILSAFLFLLGLIHLNSFQQIETAYLQKGDIQISNPEISKVYYDELKGSPREFFITSYKDFDLYLNLSVPEAANRDGRYSANVFLINGSKEDMILSTDALSSSWQEYYDSIGRDYYLKGPELEKQVLAGKYRIEIFSQDNQGKYVLAVGKNDEFALMPFLNAYWQIPLLKIQFLKTSVLQFFLTPYGIGAIVAIGFLLVLIALLYYLIGSTREIMRHSQAKTLLLTSAGMQMKGEIIKLLQKPAYDITVAFISTAAKPLENLDFLKKDWNIMRDEMGFNLEEVDIEGKTKSEVMRLLAPKDIIFVEGGNTFYLLKAMRKCGFVKIMRKLLKSGKVYIGSSAGSMVAGRSIKAAGWKNGDRNFVKLMNLRGLNLVPFDVFVHYLPEHAEIIKKKLPFKWQRKKLSILTDEQAILVQGREVSLIGKGQKIIV
jgi:dipeptidase E